VRGREGKGRGEIKIWAPIPVPPAINILQSKKVKDFYDWSRLVNIYYYGYHTLPEGISLIESPHIYILYI
jgi:hypothetical protein